jgi:hypothetical protein
MSSDSESEDELFPQEKDYWDLYYGIKDILYSLYSYDFLEFMRYEDLFLFLQKTRSNYVKCDLDWVSDNIKEIISVKLLITLNTRETYNFEDFFYTFSRVSKK